MPAVEVMDGDVVRLWFRLAADALDRTRSAIDLLNVFPVPDADTGTNLHATISGAADALAVLPAQSSPADIWQAAATAALRGACGNSGIIVSQLLCGLADICGPASPCDGPVMAAALANAAVLARAAVHRPVEGTVLTVADAAARAAADARGLGEVCRAAAFGARQALAGTRQQLGVLAASGVVDAGAVGLCVLLDALNAAITGIAPAAYEVPMPEARGAGPAGSRPLGAARPEPAPSAFGYEVTFLLQAAGQAVDGLRRRLDVLGDSLVISGREPLWHVHVHVDDAGAVIEAGMAAGQPSKIMVTYLNKAPWVLPARQSAPAGLVVVVAEGAGLATLLRSAGAEVVDVLAEPSPGAALDRLAASSWPAVLVAPPGPLASRWPAGWPVIEVGSQLQALAAVAVHDPQRDRAADLAAMRCAAEGLRWGSVVGPADAAGDRRAGWPGRGPAVVRAGGVPRAGWPGRGPAVVRAGGEQRAGWPGRGPAVVRADGEPYAGLVGDLVVARGAAPAVLAATVLGGLVTDGTEMVTLVTGRDAGPDLGARAAARVAALAPTADVVCYDGGMRNAVLLIGAE